MEQGIQYVDVKRVVASGFWAGYRSSNYDFFKKQYTLFESEPTLLGDLQGGYITRLLFLIFHIFVK